jgi:hypothetical protein
MIKLCHKYVEFEGNDWIRVAQTASSGWFFSKWNRIFGYRKYRTFIVYVTNISISGMVVVY